MRTNIELDDDLIDEALRLTGARSKREVVDTALREMIARRKRPSIMELFGIGGLAPDYDHKAARAAGGDVLLAAEAPAPDYPATAP
jgi:Arc/MetJ family transcription regulator